MKDVFSIPTDESIIEREIESLKEKLELLEKKKNLMLTQDSNEIKELVDLIKSTAEEHLMDTDEVISLIEIHIPPKHSKKEYSKKKKKPVAPKYMNPNNNSQLWTGRGRMPLWVKGLIEEGFTLEDLLIK